MVSTLNVNPEDRGLTSLTSTSFYVFFLNFTQQSLWNIQVSPKKANSCNATCLFNIKTRPANQSKTVSKEIDVKHSNKHPNLYTLENPNSLNPVKLNDVGFSINGFLVAMIFICQCIVYERGQQRVSGFCKFILFVVFLILGWLIYDFSISTLP